jgi:hypothetical protein
VSEQPHENPYPGPRPYERDEKALFFGREREKRELVSLIRAHRIVLLYAASGAGKTSLLNAGVIPALEDDEGFEVLPSLRIRAAADEPLPKDVGNVYAYSVLANLNRELDLGLSRDRNRLAGMSIKDCLKHIGDTRTRRVPRLLVIDQFEELFTVYPQFWSQREAFVLQIVEAVEDDERYGPLRILLALREDHLAELAPYARLMPDGFRIRRRLELLDWASALEAVTKPMDRTGRTFAPKVAEQLVNDLRKQRIESRRAPEAGLRRRSAWPRRWRRPATSQSELIDGEFVEPVLLQVACRSLWERLPPGITVITHEHLREAGNVDQALQELYDDAVRSALKAMRTRVVSPGAASGGRSIAATLGVLRLREGQLRARIEEEFITSLGTRDSKYKGESSTAGIPNTAVEALERERLLRGETARGARYFELTHDSLIEPIRAANRRQRERWRRRALTAAVAAAATSAVLAAAVTLVGNDGQGGEASAQPTVEPNRLEVSSTRQRSVILRSGANPLRVRAIETAPRAFSAFPQCDIEDLLPPDSTCRIIVVFAPLTRMTRTGVLRITRLGGPPLSVKLSGTAA